MQKKTKNSLWLISFFLILATPCSGQYFNFGFQRSDSIQVLRMDGTSYLDPWAGGLNNCQFFEIDLDLNGTQDLVVFDKHGNKTLPFLRFNDCGLTGFYFAPQYNDVLPKFSSWVNSVDYNLDERKDIVTYTMGGAKVYMNNSETNFGLREVKPRLYSDYGTGTPINLFISEADYPGFADIDGNESIDVVNFWALGKYIEYHQNTGVQDHSSYDSLTFRLNSSCWGKFEENESSNVLVLNSDCQSKNIVLDNQRHSGSTMLLLDLNGDNLKDIVIGDVDYPHLISLTNGGSADTAVMVQQDTLFPSVAKPVRLYSMPAAFSMDVDFDNISDLIVSPFDLSRDKAENKRSVWMYKNIGTRTSPVFDFVQPDFLQDRMIELGSGAYPTVADVNGDGLSDLVVGNWGAYDSSNYIGSFLHSYYTSSLALFLNIGTLESPKFQLVDTNFANCLALRLKGCAPTLGDIDGDNDMDLIVGDETGRLTFYRNHAGANQIPQFDSPILNYQNIRTHSYSAPQLFDLNRDGRSDLIIGDSLGRLCYYANTGTVNNPVFTFVTDSLGGVNVRNSQVSYYGYSTPCFFKKSDSTYLLVGSESGFVYSYKNIDGNLSGSFTLIDDTTFFVRKQKRVPIYEGVRSGVAVAEMNNDVYPDLFLGNYSGGLTFYQGMTPPPLTIEIGEYREKELPQYRVVPNPADHDIEFSCDNPELSAVKYVIYNSLNQVVKFGEYKGGAISVADMETGIYFVRLVSKEGQIHFVKFVKH
jgi:hypothetical protein